MQNSIFLNLCLLQIPVPHFRLKNISTIFNRRRPFRHV